MRRDINYLLLRFTSEDKDLFV